VASIQSRTGGDVDQDEIGSQAACLGDCVLAVGCLPGDRQVRFRFEDLAQADADERLVVADEDVRHRMGRTRRL